MVFLGMTKKRVSRKHTDGQSATAFLASSHDVNPLYHPQYHPLKGTEMSLIVVKSFCLESHAKTFSTEFILACGCYKCD